VFTGFPQSGKSKGKNQGKEKVMEFEIGQGNLKNNKKN